jgi:hypothetical protein
LMQPKSVTLAATKIRHPKDRCGNDGNLAKAARFPHSHNATTALLRETRTPRQNQESLDAAVEKWKSKTGISTFPPPRTACGAR